MTNRERLKARAEAEKAGKHFYPGTCSRCGCKSIHIFMDEDLCHGCEQEDLERQEAYEERKIGMPYNPKDREAAFNYEKSQQNWPDDMDKEIWDKHFRPD